MKTCLFLCIAICCQIGLLAAQKPDSDTLGYYHDGIIFSNWKNTQRHKIFQGKTLHLQEKFESGRLFKEYHRYNDSLFLYTEYYEHPDTSIQYPNAQWGIKKEGLVKISNQDTGGDIVQFDLETYEEHVYRDTLLLPIGNWNFYYPDGKIEMKGYYLDFKRQGSWDCYDLFGEFTKLDIYNKGEIFETEVENVIENTSLSITTKLLQSSWFRHDLTVNPGYTPNPKLADYRFLYQITDPNGIGETYTFNQKNRLSYTQTKLVETDYEKGAEGLSIIQRFDVAKKLNGAWKLTDYNQLEILLDGVKETYKIEYLSERTLRLKKM